VLAGGARNLGCFLPCRLQYASLQITLYNPIEWGYNGPTLNESGIT